MRRLSFHAGPSSREEAWLAGCPAPAPAPDLILVCGGRHFPAHKHKLCQASPVWESLIDCEIVDQVSTLGHLTLFFSIGKYFSKLTNIFSCFRWTVTITAIARRQKGTD